MRENQENTGVRIQNSECRRKKKEERIDAHFILTPVGVG